MTMPAPVLPAQRRARRPAIWAVGLVVAYFCLANPVVADGPIGGGEFRTDFSRHSIDLSEIVRGGPPKDGIPPIDRPQFVSTAQARRWLTGDEPVISLALDGRAKAYPIQILTWHEIVNDRLAGQPVVVTFCPLCNTAIAFSRVVDERVLDFGTTGRLRRSNLLMYDRQSESWWQQATGEAVIGDYTDTQLRVLPAQILAWREFQTLYPEGMVLSRDTGHERDYGRNPYVGYDDINAAPFLYRNEVVDGRLAPMTRVITVERGGQARAYPLATLRRERVINDRLADEPIVVIWRPGLRSALDTRRIRDGREIGAAAVFSRQVGTETLTFYPDGDVVRDAQSQSVWSAVGEAVAGPRRGDSLAPIVHINHFWFSWAAFRPNTEIYGASEG